MAEEVVSSSSEVLTEGLSLSASAESAGSASNSLDGSSTSGSSAGGPPRGPSDARRVSGRDLHDIPPR
ncbi:MAG TPA: hypothetical protein PLR99_20340 [Polyangiaceae bacterium]|nr:hypothetical protein [Polyangiaceae bacterium]